MFPGISTFSQAKHILKILWCSSLDAIIKVMNINEDRELSLCCFSLGMIDGHCVWGLLIKGALCLCKLGIIIV